MDQLTNALTRLRSAGIVRQDGRLGVSIDPDVELAPLIERIAEMRRARPLDGGARPKGIDPDLLWARWRRERPSINSFTRRELRALSWDARVAGDPVFLKELEAQSVVPSRAAFVRGLWHAHQSEWRLGTAADIERLVGACRSERNIGPRWLARVCDLPGMLTGNAPDVLAQELVEALPLTMETLQALGVTGDGRLARGALGAARIRWVHSLTNDLNGGSVADTLSSGCAGLLAVELTSLEELQQVCERLLLLVQHAGDSYRNALRSFITRDERLGHPRRVATSGNWVGFSEDAKAAAVRLFAARDLGAFFDILIGRSGDLQQRRPFWERYVNSPQLVDFAIACDQGDHARLKANWREDRPTVARLVDAPWEHSAFVMRFKAFPEDIVIAEISQANNAMYEFRASVFERWVGELAQQRFSFHSLKNRNVASNWHTHRSPWWQRFAAHLGSHGIRPGPRT